MAAKISSYGTRGIGHAQAIHFPGAAMSRPGLHPRLPAAGLDYFRPMLFARTPGHATLKAKLIGNVREGRVPHARFFLGPRGSGVLPLALGYARYLLCSAPGAGDACGKCPSCAMVDRLTHPDLHLAFPIFLSDKIRTCETFLPAWRETVLGEPFLDASFWRDRLEGENKQLRMGVDIAGEITRKLSLRAHQGGWKVMVIHLPELMDPPAANKLLKVLEEPEPGTVFLLAGHDAEHILPTILSRTQLVKVPALETADVELALRGRYNDLSPEEAYACALRSGGDLLEAVAMAEKSEQELFVLFRDWLRACYGLKIQEAGEFSEHFAKMGRERQKGLMRYGLHLLRLSILQGHQAPQLVRAAGEEQAFIERFSTLLNERNMSGLRHELEKAHAHLERNANPKVLFMDLSYRMHELLRA